MTLSILENKFDLVFTGGVRAGERFSLNHDPLTIGRTEEQSICLPDKSVSRHHATLYQLDGNWMLRDEQSTHGTFVNYRMINGPTRLRHKDTLMFGSQEVEIVDTAFPADSQATEQPVRQSAQASHAVKYCTAIICMLACTIAYMLIPPSQPAYKNVITTSTPQEMQRILLALDGGVSRGMTNHLPQSIDVVLKWD